MTHSCWFPQLIQGECVLNTLFGLELFRISGSGCFEVVEITGCANPVSGLPERWLASVVAFLLLTMHPAVEARRL